MTTKDGDASDPVSDGPATSEESPGKISTTDGRDVSLSNPPIQFKYFKLTIVQINFLDQHYL